MFVILSASKMISFLQRIRSAETKSSDFAANALDDIYKNVGEILRELVLCFLIIFKDQSDLKA